MLPIEPGRATQNGSVLILAKSNAAVAAISRAARERSKAPPQFIARILSGCLVGATVGAAAGSLIGGLLAGAVGAVVGTLGGAAICSPILSPSP
jgi:uncharacterized membrane protein